MWFVLLLVIGVLAFGLATIVLAAAAVIATLVAIASFIMPWVLILAGVWLLVRALRGPNERHRSRPAPQPNAPRHRPSAREEERRSATPRQSAPRPRPQLPIDVQVKVEQIRRKTDVLLGYADRFSPFSHDLYIVRQTTADYLPRTVEAYLAVPAVADPTLSPTAARALEELKSQLHLLDSKLDEIAEDLQRSDLNRLLANRRFLEERFGARDRGSELDRTELDAARHGSDAA